MVLRCNIVEYLPVAAVLHYQEESLGCFNNLIQLDNCRVSDNLENVDLPLNSFDVIDVFNLALV